jgi:hypothetical protein
MSFMERSLLILLTFFAATIIRPNYSQAIDSSPIRMLCSLYVARSNGRAPVVDIENQPVRIGYSDADDLNDLQPVFILSDISPETPFLQRRAVLARLFQNEYGVNVLEMGFYNAKIRFDNSLRVGVLQHPTLTSWQFEPVLVERFFFRDDSRSVDFDIDVNNYYGARITGNTNYQMVSLNCRI